MADLSTTYMGLKLKNPLIISSSGFTDSADKIRELARLGAGAVVLKSLFEEQILMDSRSYGQEGGDVYGEADDYIRGYVREHSIGEYLALIESAKRQVDIPVIASVNCVNAGEWVRFAEKIAGAGADALEVNVFVMPSDLNRRSEDLERVYFQIAEKLLRAVQIPIAMKIGAQFSGMAHMIVNLSLSGISGLVLFNRFYSPDIDLETLEMSSSSVFSNAADISAPLRWIGMLSGKAGCDMVASTGVHDGYGIA
jgi:dihydroorotate dehydrogenase (fumarate)